MIRQHRKISSFSNPLERCIFIVSHSIIRDLKPWLAIFKSSLILSPHIILSETYNPSSLHDSFSTFITAPLTPPTTLSSPIPSPSLPFLILFVLPLTHLYNPKVTRCHTTSSKQLYFFSTSAARVATSLLFSFFYHLISPFSTHANSNFQANDITN